MKTFIQKQNRNNILVILVYKIHTHMHRSKVMAETHNEGKRTKIKYKIHRKQLLRVVSNLPMSVCLFVFLAHFFIFIKTFPPNYTMTVKLL